MVGQKPEFWWFALKLVTAYLAVIGTLILLMW
jgi:hypothetical protein